VRQYLARPPFQRPIEHDADLSLYSLTKYVCGHSELIAGAALGSKALMKDVKAVRGAIGTQLDPQFPAETMHRRGLHVLVRHCRRPGRAFKFQNALQIFKLAVSLGGTESRASLPASMTHSGVPADIRQK
jgi:methionine-gamma-lyase